MTFMSCERNAIGPLTENENPAQKSSEIDHNLSYFEKEIADIINDEISFIEDEIILKMKWEDAINNHSDLSISFDEIKIFEEGDNYFLRGKDKGSFSSSFIQLVKKGDKFYEVKTPGGGGITVTCTGCESTGPDSSGECEPQINPHNGFYCTDCSLGTCTKTTTTIMVGGGAGIL